jgi:hypothetical protein
LAVISPSAASHLVDLAAPLGVPTTLHAAVSLASAKPGGSVSSEPNRDPIPVDPEQGDDGSAPLGPTFPVGPGSPRGGNTPTNGGDDVFDIGLAGPLVWTDSQQSTSDPTVAAALSDDPAGDDASFVTSGPSTRVETSIDFGGGWIAYLSSGEWQESLPELTSWRGPAVDHRLADFAPAASVTNDNPPLFVLLQAPDVQAASHSPGLEPFAELGPAEGSSALALAATLWGVASESQKPSLAWTQRSEAAADRLDGAAPGSRWRDFVIALDGAIDEACRDVRDELFPRTPHSIVGHRQAAAGDEGLEWHGPIVPAPGPMLDSKAEGAHAAGTARSDEAGHGRGAHAARPTWPPVAPNGPHEGYVRSDQVPKPNAEEAAPAVALCSAVAASALVAGWCLASRAPRPRSRQMRRSLAR